MISMATSIKNGISSSASARFPAIGGSDAYQRVDTIHRFAV
jgi:hypothetical protein